ncbi:hypothetical protein Droror1_Dr00015434 [Drosera rotundifolia]
MCIPLMAEVGFGASRLDNNGGNEKGDGAAVAAVIMGEIGSKRWRSSKMESNCTLSKTIPRRGAKAAKRQICSTRFGRLT